MQTTEVNPQQATVPEAVTRTRNTIDDRNIQSTQGGQSNRLAETSEPLFDRHLQSTEIEHDLGFGTYRSTGGMHDRNIALRLAQMEALISRIPGVPAPIKKSLPSSYADSPFVDDIAPVEMPRKFSLPNMKLYDGTTDPDDHIAQYKQRMFTAAIPRDLREACMCKGFGSSLMGPTLQWYTNLHNNSISSFAKLTDVFVEHFASSRKLEKHSEELYRIKQKRGEKLQDYVGRFNREKVSIPSCNIDTAITAFRKGLLSDSDLYKELTKYPCRTMEDVLAKAWAQIKWEEDEAKRPYTRTDTERRSSRKEDRVDRRNNSYRFEPYTDDQRRKPEAREYGRPSSKQQDRIRWPEKYKFANDKRDMTKWCEFHGDHGHNTADCIALRLKVAELLKRGHLRDFLSDKGRATTAARNENQTERKKSSPHEHPQPRKTISVISGGSEVSGITYSAAKRHARGAIRPEAHVRRPISPTFDQTLSFEDSEAAELVNPHHDALGNGN
ncbi:hypothetical protein BVC80_8953g11 [Macleaya cordata]|uniref:Retrotransposon gag domain-containing protein n=1 Tax=Macleaya cordata TaxID=56857 RepID=A0A200QWQ5_MACCD|nr:hypothetical protein BVC80_8953g11 [Macleaya cordata]